MTSLAEQQQACLEFFVLRARRVELHSLAADQEQIVRWATHQMTMEGTASGRTWLVQRLPREELLESLAARVRPFILQRDPIHYGKVLTAIGYLLNPEDRETAKPTIDQLRKMWRQVNPDSRQLRAYSAQVTETGTGETSDALSSDRLAFAWIYGDTIHADPARQAEAERFGIQERYRAAVGIIAELVINTVATLNVVRALNAGGKLTLTEDVFEREVIVTETESRQEAQFFIADQDTPPPLQLTNEPGPGWRRLTGPGDLTASGATPESNANAVVVQIRPSSLADASVRALLGDWGLGNWGSVVEVDEFVPPKGAFLAAWIDDQAVGCVGVRRRVESEAEVKRLFVAAEARGRTLGRHLLTAAETAATELGYSSTVLDTDGSSDAALALFRDAGYQEVADYNGNTLARHWFRKSLTGT